MEDRPEELRRDEPWIPVLPAIEVHEVEGGHSGAGSLLDEPYVGATAAAFQRALLGPSRTTDRQVDRRAGPQADRQAGPQGRP